MASNKNPFYRNDFAHFAVMAEKDLRVALLKHRDKAPYFPLTHKELLARAPQLLNVPSANKDLFGDLSPEQIIEEIAAKTWINSFEENPERLRASVRKICKAIMEFAREHDVTGRARHMRGFQILPGIPVTNFWMNAVLRIRNQNTVLFMNPRSKNFTLAEQRFVFSLMREGVAEGLAVDRDELQLGILEFYNSSNGGKVAELSTSHGVEYHSLEEIQEMAAKLATIWKEVNSDYGDEKATGTNDPRLF